MEKTGRADKNVSKHKHNATERVAENKKEYENV